MAGNSSIALELDGRRARRTTRASARPGGGSTRVQRRRAVLPGGARRGQRRDRRRRGGGRDRARARRAATRTARSLAEVQYVQHLIADMDIAVRAARLLVQDAARLGEAGDESALVAIMEAKVAATEAAAAVTQQCARGDRRPGLHAGAADRAAPARRSRRGGDGADERGAAQLDRQGARGAPGSMSARRDPRRRGRLPPADRHDLGAVPRRTSRSAGCPTDYVLFSNYERLVDALLAGTSTSPGTRTPPTWRRSSASAATPGARHARRRRATSATVSSTRRGEAVAEPSRAGRQAARARQPRLRPRRDPAAALPAARARAPASCELLRFDTDLGKHGDTGDSELASSRRSPTATPTRARSATPLGRALGPRASRGRRARDRRGAAPSTTTATSRRCRRSTKPCERVERGAARDGLRRPALRAGDGPRGRQALAAGRQARLRRPPRRCASRAASRERRGAASRARSSSAAGWRSSLGGARARLAGGELDVVAVARGRAASCRRGRGSPATRSGRAAAEPGRRRFVVRVRRGALRGCWRRLPPRGRPPPHDGARADDLATGGPSLPGGGSARRPRPARRRPRAGRPGLPTGRSRA